MGQEHGEHGRVSWDFQVTQLAERTIVGPSGGPPGQLWGDAGKTALPGPRKVMETEI